jgi:ATP-dependent RNA helicase RhlE
LTFESFHFHPSISDNIKKMGYISPTPIQEQAIGPALEGRDIMGLAQTGTGKTAAFMLPILQRFINRPPDGRRNVRALIVAPTRELAEQIHQAALDLGQKMRLRSLTVYGGVGMNPQVRSLRQGVDLVVACPGRLLDHIRQGNVTLSQLETVVLDEADHMFDMGFLPDIRKILSFLPPKRQTLLFSATMPQSIIGLAKEILSNPVMVSIGTQAPIETISHAIYPVTPTRKTPLLLHLLREHPTQSVIVFTKTKHRAKKLAVHLETAGHKTTCLQGNLSQRRRQEAMEGFRRGTYRVLVATDIAARGIDVSQVGHVINYDIPDTPEAYTHRIGRTGRAERTGQAHTMVTHEDMGMVRAVERLLGKPLHRLTPRIDPVLDIPMRIESGDEQIREREPRRAPEQRTSFGRQAHQRNQKGPQTGKKEGPRTRIFL